MAPLKNWQRGDAVTSDKLNAITKAIPQQIVGGRGIQVRMDGNRIIIELSEPQRWNRQKWVPYSGA